jgi:hypothetical protein
MSEYPIGINGEMIHCLDNSTYAKDCRSKLEKDIKSRDIDFNRWKEEEDFENEVKK